MTPREITELKLKCLNLILSNSDNISIDDAIEAMNKVFESVKPS